MSTPRDPKRLEFDAPPEVAQVIDALRNDAPSRDDMQRMAHRFGAWLESPGAAAGPAGGLLGRPLAKIGLLVLGSGALLAGLTYVLRSSGAHELAPAVSTPVSGTAPALRGGASTSTPSAVDTNARAQPIPAPAAALAPAPQRAPEVELAPSAATSGTNPRPAVVPRVRARFARHAKSAATREVEPAGAVADRDETAAAPGHAEPEDTLALAARQAVVEEPSVPPAAPQQAPSPKPAAAPAARAQDSEQPTAARPMELDEAAILQRARRLARTQPSEALRLLDEHKRRYPHGILTPEREVLAIEILRAQSRDSEARARLQSFRQHYPKSVYLERLEHPRSAL